MKSIGTPYRRAQGLHGSWDAIVIGSGMGGLTTSSLLAKEGLRVLLLEQNRILGGCTQSYERDGYRWTVGMHYIGGLQSEHSHTWKLFDKVTDGGIEWNELPPIYNRMVIGGREYEIPAGRKPYADFLKNRFPAESAAIDEYMKLMGQVNKSSGAYFGQKALPESVAEGIYDEQCGPFHQFSDRLTIDVLSELTSDPELIAVWCANWGDYSLPPSKSSFAIHCMLFNHYVKGAHYPSGGGGAFAQAVVPIVESAGGSAVYSAEVEQILVRDGRAVGVRLVSGEEVHSALVISNAGVQNTFKRLLDPTTASAYGLTERLNGVVDSYTVVGANIGLSISKEELNVHPANIWAHPSHDFDANLAAHGKDFSKPFPFIFVTFPSAKDSSWDKDFPGKSTIEIHAGTNYEHFAQWQGTSWRKRGEDYEARKEDISTRLLEALYEIVPAARGAVDVVEISTPLSYETFLKREHGGFMGIEASPDRFRQRWLRAPTPIAGLFLTGQDVATDGLIGAMVGGFLTASSILKRDLMSETRTPRSN